jgi:hypothetical protein
MLLPGRSPYVCSLEFRLMIMMNPPRCDEDKQERASVLADK